MTVRLSAKEIRIAKTKNDLSMLVNQRAFNFTFWIDAETLVDVITDTLKREFEL